MSQNLASKYSNKVDERFYRESQALAGTNKDYEWTGVDTVNVYQVDTVPLNDYQRSGNTRYGQAPELGNTIKSYTLTQDKSFTFTIDKGNKNQSMMVTDAGKSLSREQREVMVPYVDRYIFKKQADAAVANSQVEVAAASTSTAYQKFLKGQEVLGNKDVPDTGRIGYCSYAFANLLMLDPAFIKQGEKSQEMTIKGSLGEVDGVKIVKVPSSRLPLGTSFLLVHPSATTAPEQLKEFRIHQDPPGISGWLVEGRFIFDAFVLEAKKDALYLGMLDGTLQSVTATLDADNKPVVANADRYVGTLKIKAGTTLPAYGDADTGYTEVTSSTTVAADSIIAYSVDGKITAAGLIDVA